MHEEKHFRFKNDSNSNSRIENKKEKNLKFHHIIKSLAFQMFHIVDGEEAVSWKEKKNMRIKITYEIFFVPFFDVAGF